MFKPGILLIDDERNICEAVKLVLDDEYNIYWAANEKEALKKAKMHKDIFLILLDVNLGRENGFDILSRLRHILYVPVIVFTAYSTEGNYKKAIQCGGIHDFISKPFSVEDFRKRVKTVITAVIADIDVKRAVSEAVFRALQYIWANYSYFGLSVEKIAEECGICGRHLRRRFDEQLGISVVEYIHRFRIAQGALLLMKSHPSVTEASLAVGIGKPAYFTELFKKYKNETPVEFVRRYRKELKQKEEKIKHYIREGNPVTTPFST